MVRPLKKDPLLFMENKTPRFSIVIPTKDRPASLSDAIWSVLRQNFTDFELIISDNHNDEKTQDVLNKFRALSHVKIIKPHQELKMIDHWEFATKHAMGEYVILLADRKVLYQSALKKLNKIANTYSKINTFSVGVQTYDEMHHKMGWCNAIGKTIKFNSDKLVYNFLNENLFTLKSLDIYFPKTLNGMYKNSFANKVRAEFGQYFNTPGVTTPDYSSFFINTALNEEIVYVGEKIILTQGEQSSNGRIFGAGKFQAYMDSLGYSNPYQFVPIKAPIIYNLLMVDYLTIQATIKKDTSASKLNWTNYFIVNYFEMLNKKDQGLDDTGFLYFEQAWENALSNSSLKLDSDQLKSSAMELYKVKNLPGKGDKLKRFQFHLRDFLAARFSKTSLVNKIYPFEYRDIFHAAGFSSYE